MSGEALELGKGEDLASNPDGDAMGCDYGARKRVEVANPKGKGGIGDFEGRILPSWKKDDEKVRSGSGLSKLVAASAESQSAPRGRARNFGGGMG